MVDQALYDVAWEVFGAYVDEGAPAPPSLALVRRLMPQLGSPAKRQVALLAFEDYAQRYDLDWSSGW